VSQNLALSQMTKRAGSERFSGSTQITGMWSICLESAQGSVMLLNRLPAGPQRDKVNPI
jgi:hypothetical protein